MFHQSIFLPARPELSAHKPALRSPRRARARTAAGAALLMASCLLLTACGKSENAAPPQLQALPVGMLTVKSISLPSSVEVVAQTEGAKETEVRARVGGILMKRLHHEGSKVEAGQPLFQIDRAPYEIAFAQAKARAEQTAREERRLKGLAAKQAVSQKEYDDSYSANAVAQAELNQARLNLQWTTVTAPVSGVTGRAIKSEGSLVTAGADSLLTSIYQNNPIWVRFGLSENEASHLPDGRPTPETITGVELILPNGKTYGSKGRINFLASTIDPTLGTQQLRAEFDNPDNELLPGQFVRVRLLSKVRDNVFLVPQSAVVQTEKAYLLMTADKDNKVTPRPVQVAEWYGTNWVITGGLQNGDRVIIDNLLKLRPGAQVLDRATLQAPAGGAPAASKEPAKN